MAKAKTTEDEYSGPDPVSLAEAASTALAGIVDGDGAAQEALDPALGNVTKVKFVGMAMDSVEDISLHQEVTFLVRARCTAETVEELKDGGTRSVRRMEVLNVTIRE